MGAIKATFFMEDGTNGWTESYYNNSVTTLPAALPVASALAAKRAVLLGKQGFIRYIRLSEEGVRGDSLVSIAGIITYQGTPQEDSDFSDTALLLRCQTADRRHRKMVFLRGIWDKVVDQAGNYLPGLGAVNQWNAKLTAFIGQLATGWGWIGSTGVLGRSNIFALAQNLTGQWTITASVPVFTFPLPAGTTTIRVRLSGVNGATLLNGSQLVIPTSTTVATTVARIPGFPWAGSGKITLAPTQFWPIEVAEITRVVERKAGRPSYRSPGRARRRVLS